MTTTTFVYCPKCGVKNEETASFCSACGAPLKSATTIVSPPSPLSSGRPEGKSAAVAAILNLFWGIGYLYLGYKKVLGLPTVAFVIVALVVYIVLGIFTIGLLTLLAAILLAVDGYQKAKGKAGFIRAQM